MQNFFCANAAIFCEKSFYLFFLNYIGVAIKSNSNFEQYLPKCKGKLFKEFDQFFVKMKYEETNLLNAYENLKENRL